MLRRIGDGDITSRRLLDKNLGWFDEIPARDLHRLSTPAVCVV